MARAGLRYIVVGLAAAGLLMGCVEGGGKTGAGAGVAAPVAKKKTGSRDVEAPEVFETTDSALWDGRPSLGGIWVAAPEVENPERAIMFNPATGKSVTGALFKRERENPGPRLQLSSDAAEALGILAGQPTEIRVVALRKEELAEPEPAKAAETPTPDEGAAKPASDKDAAAIATAALAAVDAKKKEPAQQSKDADPAAAAAAAGAVAVGAEAAADAVAPAPKRKTWKERRAEAKAAREAKKKAAAEAAAVASAAEAEAAMADREAPTATPETAAVAPVESAPLDARKPDVANAPAAEPSGTTAPKRKTIGEPAAPAAKAAADPAPAASGGPGRTIQVASFSKEDNAKRAAEALAKIGITATARKSERNGQAVWGVIVTGDAAMLKKIKDAGFADAYFLK